MVDGPNRHVTFELFKGLFNLSQKKILLPNYSKNHDAKKKLHQWHFILEELSRQADEMRRVPIHVGTLTAIAVSRLGDAGRAPVAPPAARQILGPARTTGPHRSDRLHNKPIRTILWTAQVLLARRDLYLC